MMERKIGDRCCVPANRALLDPHEVQELAADLEILANPVRLQLLAALAANEGEVCVCDLQELLPVKQPTVSHHLALLRKAGLVGVDRRGLWAYYHVRRDALAEVRERISGGLGLLVGEAARAAVEE